MDVIDKEGNIQFKLLDKGKNENFSNISNEAYNSIGDKFKVKVQILKTKKQGTFMLTLQSE